MRYTGGVDVGSTQTKAVILDEGGRVAGRALLDMETSMVTIAQDAFRAALADAGVEEAQVARIASTGYGRYNVSFGHEQVTEISCHARGAHALFPNTRTVIDMGGQDSKAISVDENGHVLDFVMNDKCAAGTGRFLANAAEVLGLGLGEFGALSAKATHPVKITTVCTVFVESDILSYLALGKKPEDIVRGVHLAIAKRTVSLARRVPLEPAVTLTGGVSRNEGMVAALEEILGVPLQVSPQAHFAGALGAALHALDRVDASFEAGVWRTAV